MLLAIPSVAVAIAATAILGPGSHSSGARRARGTVRPTAVPAGRIRCGSRAVTSFYGVLERTPGVGVTVEAIVDGLPLSEWTGATGHPRRS